MCHFPLPFSYIVRFICFLMKNTIFVPFKASFYNAGMLSVVLDYATQRVKDGNDIVLAYCDGKLFHRCSHNMSANKAICRCCMLYKKLLFKYMPKKNVQYLPFSKFSDSVKNNYSIDFNSVEDLKKLEYKNVKIGYAVFSSYLTLSRNLFPEINEEFKDYMRKALTVICQYVDVAEAIMQETKPDVVECHNSRTIQARPIVDLARSYHIPYICSEQKFNTKNQQVKVSFESTVHDVDENTLYIDRLWNSDKFSPECKKKVAESFFYKRRNSIASGDKLYVKDQKQGLLPENWDEKKHNICILNSSEDEFASLGEDFEKGSLFNSQYEGIKCLIDRYEHQEGYHFYLRVHPNLKNVKYRYHTALYKLFENKSNFTIIPADSPISTYAVIDASDKVIVFGSTTGPEASYAGKPVVLLSKCIYSKLDCCYIPQNLDEMDSLILDRNLVAKPLLNALKYGYYRYNDEEELNQYCGHSLTSKKIGNHRFDYSKYSGFTFFDKFLSFAYQVVGKKLYYKHLSFPRKESLSEEV